MLIGNLRALQLQVLALGLMFSIADGCRIGMVTAEGVITQGGETPALVIPVRRAPDAPPAASPALPAAAERLVPITIEAVIHRQPASGKAQTVHQTITRTSDRVHISVRNGPEWVFQSNPRDPRRVSGALIEHASQAIVLYEESDLRITLGIRGWADVLTLGFDHTLLAEYERAPDTSTMAGIRFARYTGKSKGPSGGEVWWSEEYALPSRFVTHEPGGVSRFSIEKVKTGVDQTLLRVADERFPQYRVFDLSNWLERH